MSVSEAGSTVSKEDLIKSITTGKPEPNSEELESFKNLVNDWFKYDDQIRKLDAAIKERKNYQKVLNKKIQDFMMTYQYNDLNTQHGRIKSYVRESKVPIKITDIKDRILKHKDMSGEELLNQIFNEERNTVVKKNIRRVIPTVSLSL
jgi:hypothetical protein